MLILAPSPRLPNAANSINAVEKSEPLFKAEESSKLIPYTHNVRVQLPIYRGRYLPFVRLKPTQGKRGESLGWPLIPKWRESWGMLSKDQSALQKRSNMCTESSVSSGTNEQILYPFKKEILVSRAGSASDTEK